LLAGVFVARLLLLSWAAHEMAASNAIKVVLMGQGGVGKTAMVLRYTTGDFNEQYMPTIGDMYTKDVEVSGAPRHVEIDDTAGQEAYADLKKEKMSTGDGYLLVYSITDDTTFGKLDRLRDEIIKAQGGRQVPVFLVGTKADLASDRAVSDKERLAKARAWGCQSFEVSAKTDVGVSDVFEKIVQAILAVSADPSKGAGGGGVMGAGRTPLNDTMVPKKKTCIFL
jgi:small GTP-binding protein